MAEAFIPKLYIENYKGGGGGRRPSKPIIKNTRNMTKNKKNKIFAIPAAISAIIKKVNAHPNMMYPPYYFYLLEKE